MKIRFLLLILILSTGCTYCQESNKFDNFNYAPINTLHGSYIGDTYYSNNAQNPTSYTKRGNQIYGSDGSSYTKYDNMIQNNSSGKTYQIINNTIPPLD